ncbi:putative short chain dehydrogenase/ reductase [Myxozyma melibiosi]|uniref:Short chain dehydrogenase/ reductase n=1 Tax=Myxozyma melibiosi TaxID=54550 RepID=A0ABR1F0P2_9ASCO
MAGISGRIYSVSGAASGIGRATVIRLASLGAGGLAISDVNEAGLNETIKLCERYQSKITTTVLDVRKPEDVDQWIEETVSQFGKLDGAANVAGLAGGDGSNVASLNHSDWDRMIGVNLTGVMNCMHAQLKSMTRPGGAIVNVASTSGLRGFPNNSAYSSSKFGVIGLTLSAAGEYGTEGIRINAILPGPIDTPIIRDGEKKGLFDAASIYNSTLMKRLGDVDEVAKVLCFMLSDDASYVTGAQWTVDGGYSAC